MIDTERIFYENLIQVEMDNIDNKLRDECCFNRKFKGYAGEYCNAIPIKYCKNKICKYQGEIKENILNLNKRYDVLLCNYELYKRGI